MKKFKPAYEPYRSYKPLQKAQPLNELLFMDVRVQPITAILVEKLCNEVKNLEK